MMKHNTDEIYPCCTQTCLWLRLMWTTFQIICLYTDVLVPCRQMSPLYLYFRINSDPAGKHKCVQKGRNML
jgi:hypothetical protein